METFTAASQPLTEQQLQRLASLCDVFSPNEAEALSMLGQAGITTVGWPDDTSKGSSHSTSSRDVDGLGRDSALLQLTQPFLEAGARVVAIRRGENGALVHSEKAGAWEVPAIPGTEVVDTTGEHSLLALLAGVRAHMSTNQRM